MSIVTFLSGEVNAATADCDPSVFVSVQHDGHHDAKFRIPSIMAFRAAIKGPNGVFGLNVVTNIASIVPGIP